MKKGVFICFIGIDGSGKTTIAKSLVEMLNGKGVNAKYVYGRYIPFLTKPAIWFTKLLFLRNKNIYENYVDYSDTKKEKSKKHSFLAKIYQDLLFFDYFFQILFRIKLPLEASKNIICDRYIYDTLFTDLAIDFNYSSDQIKSILRRFSLYFPKPDIIFLIDIPEEVAFRRKNDIPSIRYLRDRRRLYLLLRTEAVVLDGSMEIEQIKSSVYRKIKGIIQ